MSKNTTKKGTNRRLDKNRITLKVRESQRANTEHIVIVGHQQTEKDMIYMQILLMNFGKKKNLLLSIYMTV